MKDNICMIGHFAIGTDYNDGQTVKTREIYNQLENEKYQIEIIDTYKFKKKIFSFLFKIIKNFFRSKYVILVVASGGAKILIPFLTFINFSKKRKICYCCVGSWLDDRIDNDAILRKSVKKLDTIFVETDDLQENLEKRKLNNIKKLYNFKMLDLSQIAEKKKKNHFCVFSRIMEQKGISDAIYVFKKLKDDGYECQLDIYGPINNDYKEKFFSEIENCSNAQYCGSKQPNMSVKYVSQYCGLIFPTHYLKEGLPGTLIDAYFSGTPIISSNWKSATEFVPPSVGFVYEFASKEKLYEIMKNLLDNPKLLEGKQQGCKEFAQNFIPSEAIKPLISFLEK